MTGAGKLRQRLLLEAPADVPDGAGGRTRSWSLVAALWGEVRPVRMTELVEADARRAEATHRITIRHRDDVRADMRFTQGPRSFRITGMSDPDGRRAWLVCQAVEEQITP